MTGARDPSSVPGAGSASRPTQSAEQLLARIGLPEVADELLAMVGFLTAPEGPLWEAAETDFCSFRHGRVLAKMGERIAVIEDFLRGRIASLVSGTERGDGLFDAEVELAEADLDANRALATVVERLLAGAVPTEGEFDFMGDTTLRIYAALEAL